jgi:hypothetical protein
MHRSVPYPFAIRRGEKVMRRLVVFLLLWTVCLVAGGGCGKEPPVQKEVPMRNARIPTQRAAPEKTP